MNNKKTKKQKKKYIEKEDLKPCCPHCGKPIEFLKKSKKKALLYRKHNKL